MADAFKPGRRFGKHFQLACTAGGLMKGANFLKKGRNEREFEQAVVAVLESSPELDESLITQVGEGQVPTVTESELFGFKHRPDIAIGRDGTAIEIKAATRGFSVRDLLGQALAYRMHYRFVILVLIDQTPDRQIVSRCEPSDSCERRLLQWLSDELEVFTIVGPVDKGKNLAFLPEMAGGDAGAQAGAA